MRPHRTIAAVASLLVLSTPTHVLAHSEHADYNADQLKLKQQPPRILKSIQEVIASTTDWTIEHMQSEHHIGVFDGATFFALHDYDSDGAWEPEEILRTYGLAEGSTDGLGGPGATMPSGEIVPQDRRDALVADALARFDANEDRVISRDEFVTAWNEQGERLKDWSIGPGHHGDDEWEYEVHHFERYHDENTTEEELTHPEDIAHFRHHEEMEAAQARQEAQDKLQIVEKNIPRKFWRDL